MCLPRSGQRRWTPFRRCATNSRSPHRAPTERAVNCRKQAKACAVCSPFPGILSAMGMLRQLSHPVLNWCAHVPQVRWIFGKKAGRLALRIPGFGASDSRNNSGRNVSTLERNLSVGRNPYGKELAQRSHRSCSGMLNLFTPLSIER